MAPPHRLPEPCALRAFALYTLLPRPGAYYRGRVLPETGCFPRPAWDCKQSGQQPWLLPSSLGLGTRPELIPELDWFWEAAWGWTPVALLGASPQMTPTAPRFCQSPGTPGEGAGEPPPLLLVSVRRDVSRDEWERGGDAGRGRRV